MLNLLYILYGHCHITMPKYTNIEHSKLRAYAVWYDAQRALYADFGISIIYRLCVHW